MNDFVQQSAFAPSQDMPSIGTIEAVSGSAATARLDEAIVLTAHPSADEQARRVHIRALVHRAHADRLRGAYASAKTTLAGSRPSRMAENFIRKRACSALGSRGTARCGGSISTSASGRT